MKWTEKQQQVIDARNRNLLVSAAAGSGKTAVLVERIIQLISEGEHPLDLDQLLVMTFTNAAAAEMRERIAAAIEKKLMEQPENRHLQVQAALVPHAQITTIDSFCLNLIRNHFNQLDIDPGFRIGDEGELLLLRTDVMEGLLEEYYQKDDPEFEQFVETYATGRTDAGIEDYIMQVYRFAQSNPFPAKWIQKCREEIRETRDGGLEETAWMKFLMEDARRQLAELEEQLRDAYEVCLEENGPQVYQAVLMEECGMLRNLKESTDYRELNKRLVAASFGRLPASRSKDVDSEKKQQVTDCRDRVKKAVADLRGLYGVQTEEEAAADLLGTSAVVLKLLELTEEFDRRFQESKREKNIVDFNDLEHYALEILICQEGDEDQNGILYTETADQLSRQYAEILVDEYQDSNYVQEALIQSLSGERFGRPNVFMVGDVKQSIYKFRLARPELFMEKYASYTDGDSPSQKIELHQNFRSRKSVLDSVNHVFYRAMTKNLGNVEYTEDAALHPGAVFAECPDHETGGKTELLLADTGKAVMGDADEELAEYTSREIEAKMIASRARELTDPVHGQWIWDKEKECYRPAEYGDMVILLRSISGWTESFINVLTQEGIPAYAETGSGYFDTVEVETILSMLAVIDNPMQDIPLAAVLRSPIGGLTDEELAWMMAEEKKSTKKGQDRGIYQAFRRVLGEIQEEQNYECQGNAEYHETEDDGIGHAEEDIWLQVEQEVERERQAAKKSNSQSWKYTANVEYTHLLQKLQKFDQLLQDLRFASSYLPIHELLFLVYEKTGYYDYASSMPAGETRKANLDMLVEKASAYEKTSYKGLFQFIRYIHKLKKYEMDFGEAQEAGKQENRIRIMSIHKSKGLEFPIVFLAGMGKKFNKQDVRGRLVIDMDLGIGTDHLDLEQRTQNSTLKKNVMKRKMDLDNLGEELRVLYVAMTRAKEKLIMTGTDRSLAKKLGKWRSLEQKGQIPYTVLTTAGSYLDWVLMTAPEESELFEVKEISVESMVGETVARKLQKHISREALLSLPLDRIYDEELAGELEHHLTYEYEHLADVGLHTKATVSELKRAGQPVEELSEEEQSVDLFAQWQNAWQQEQPEAEIYNVHERAEDKPGELVEGESATEKSERDATEEQNEEQKSHLTDQEKRQTEKQAMERAAKRGTAYHRILELLDFTAAASLKDVKTQIHEMVTNGKISEENAQMVRPGEIWKFVQTETGRRMAQTQGENHCHREQQFVMGIPAREMHMGDSDELVLIQGIIDVWLEEADGIVLLDYKTDHVSDGEILVKRYKVQLDYYQRALEQMTGKKVKERIIYSLSLQQEIPC